jgi:hemerythrin
MSKVDWAVAESTYVTKPEASYDWLAQMFGTAKSTVVRQAVKRNWPKKREEYTEKRIQALEENVLETRLQVEERHLKTLRLTQTVFHNQIVRLANKQQQDEGTNGKEWNTIASLTRAMTKAIMTERTILGLSSKPIRIKNAEAIENIQRIMGHKVEPLDQKYRESKALLEGIDIEAILKHKKILEQYVKKVEETGDVTIEHPLW